MKIIIIRPEGKGRLEIDLTALSVTEARIDEIAGVTHVKAPELMGAFNRAYLETNKKLNLMAKQLAETKRYADKVRSRIILDKVPGILQQKGLATAKNPMGSEDMRNAILSTDEEYIAAQEMLSEHECHYELIKGKLKGFEMAYGAVKRVMGDSPNHYGHRDGFHAPAAADTPGGKAPKPGFGKVP